MQKKEKGIRRKPSIKQKLFHRPNRRRSRTSQQSSSGAQVTTEEAKQITRISSAMRAITSIFKRRKEKRPINYVINEEPASSSGINASVDVLNVNTILESKSVSDAEVTFAEKEVDTNLDLYFFEGSESKTVLVATTQISSSDWTELVKILSSEKNIKYLASKTRAIEDECELENLESTNVPTTSTEKQMTLDVITQYSQQSIDNKAVNTHSDDFFVDNKGRIHNLEMAQTGTVSVTPSKCASTQNGSFANRELVMNLSASTQTDPCKLSLLSERKIIQPADASTETHHNFEYERTKNAFTATTELNECSSCYEEYRRNLKHIGTECYLNNPTLPRSNNLSAINLVYRLDCINREAVGDNVYLLPVTKSFRKEINEALDLLKSSEDKLRRLNYIKDHHQMIKTDEKERLTKPSEYCNSLKNMSEEFRNVTSKIATKYLEEYSGRYDELENHNFYLMKPRAFDILSKIEVDPNFKYFDEDETAGDNSLHKEIVTLEKLIEEITNLENKIKERDCLYQDMHLIREDRTSTNKATNSEPESFVEAFYCQPNENSSVVSKPLDKKLYAHSDNMSKENRMYQQRQFSNSNSVPNLSKEEVDKTIKLLETTREDLLKFVHNNKKFKQTNKFALRNQAVDFPPQEKKSDDFSKRPQNKMSETNKKKCTFVTDECCFYEEHLPTQTIGNEITNNSCPKIDKIDKEFLERYTRHKLEVLETLTKAISNLKNSFDEQFSLLKNQSSTTCSSCSRNQSEGFIKNIVNDMITSISASSTKHKITHHTTQTEPTESQRCPTSLRNKETLSHVIIEEMIVCDSTNNKQTQISIETTSEREISTRNTNLDDSPIYSCSCKYVDSLEDLSAEFDRCSRREKVFDLSCAQTNMSEKIFSDDENLVIETVNE